MTDSGRSREPELREVTQSAPSPVENENGNGTLSPGSCDSMTLPLLRGQRVTQAWRVLSPGSAVSLCQGLLFAQIGGAGFPRLRAPRLSASSVSRAETKAARMQDSLSKVTLKELPK